MHDNFYIKEKQKKLTQQKHARKHVIEEKQKKNHARAAPAKNLKVKCY